MLGEHLTRWTIRLALAACVACWVIELSSRQPTPLLKALARGLWTFGCLALWLHVACAFHFYHDWSHSAAFEQTARETRLVTGFDWGGGVWINYLLMLLWSSDVAWRWINPQSFRARPKALNRAWLSGFAFIAFNATVVFEEGAVRYAGIGATVLLTALLIARRLGAHPVLSSTGDCDD
ncbi:MAG: hypothetical protein EXS05_19655 [Planctomycetaceae bacterium]|nr:hypothetical protein [Planctomycetaceae bacterium]